MYVRHDRNVNGCVSDAQGPDDAGSVQGGRDNAFGSDPALPDRYKLVLFNNEVLRLDSVSGMVWILDVQRDPQSRQVVKPRWVAVEPPPSEDANG